MFSFGDRVLLGYTHTLRTREFAGGHGADSFGSLFLQVQW